MLHVNNRDGFTIAVSENRLLARIAQSTVLSDDAFSVMVPILEQRARLAIRRDPRALRVERSDAARVGEGADRPRHVRATTAPTTRLSHDGVGSDGRNARPRGGAVTIEYLGWAATAVFVASYFCTRSHVLKAVQMVGALMGSATPVHRRAAGRRGEPGRVRGRGLDAA